MSRKKMTEASQTRKPDQEAHDGSIRAVVEIDATEIGAFIRRAVREEFATKSCTTCDSRPIVTDMIEGRLRVCTVCLRRLLESILGGLVPAESR